MTAIIRISTILVAVALLATAAGPAGAKQKPGPTGVYAGVLTTVAPGTDIAYEQKLVITIARLRGTLRVAGLAARVRLYCDDGVMDIPLVGAGRPGPKVDGAGRFTITREGVTITGRAGTKALTGTVSAQRDGCSLKSTSFTLRKRAI